MSHGSERNEYIDFVKGIAIYMVIFGHALQYGSGSEYLANGLYWDNQIMKAVYSVHMPLLIAISGYFYWASIQKRGPIKSALNRVKQFLPTCVVWGIALWLLRIVLGKSHGIKTLVRLCMTDFWFLWTIMISACIVSLVEYIASGKNEIRVCMYGLLLGISLFTPDLYWLGAHKFMLFFFISGVCYSKHISDDWLSNHTLTVVALLIWCAMIPFYRRDSYIYISGFTLLGKENWLRQIMIDLYRFIIGIAGIVALLNILKIIYRKACTSGKSNLVDFIRRVGTQSVSIYVLSTYLFIYVLPLLTRYATVNYLLTFTESIFILISCYALGRLMQKSNALGRIILAQGSLGKF